MRENTPKHQRSNILPIAIITGAFVFASCKLCIRVVNAEKATKAQNSTSETASNSEINAKFENIKYVELSDAISGKDWKTIIDSQEAVMVRYSDNYNYDEMFDEYMKYAISKNKLVGIYFDIDSSIFKEKPKTFADWCTDQTKSHQGKVIFALRYEDKKPIDAKWFVECIDSAKIELIPYKEQVIYQSPDISDQEYAQMDAWAEIIASHPTCFLSYGKPTEPNMVSHGIFVGNAEQWHELASAEPRP